MIIGITGRIATGKSTLADCFKKRGIPVFDADSVYSDLFEHNKAMRNEIQDTFKTLDKSRILNIVSENKKMLDKLNDITHGYVIEQMNLFILKHENENMILDVPIPVQKGFVDICDLVIVTVCDQDIQIDRLKKRYDTDKKTVINRISMQKSQQEYINIANIILNTNNTTKKDLELFTDTFFNTILAQQC